MAEEKVDLGFLGRRLESLNDEMRLLRKDVTDIRRATLVTAEYAQRIKSQQSDLVQDLELTVKIELGGAIAHLKTALDERLDRMEAKIDDLSGSR